MFLHNVVYWFCIFFEIQNRIEPVTVTATPPPHTPLLLHSPRRNTTVEYKPPSFVWGPASPSFPSHPELGEPHRRVRPVGCPLSRVHAVYTALGRWVLAANDFSLPTCPLASQISTLVTTCETCPLRTANCDFGHRRFFFSCL